MSQLTDRIGYPELLVKEVDFELAKRLVFKELGAHYKHDASDVNVQGYSIIRLYIDTEEMTDDFYEKIRQSQNIALLSDGALGRRNREAALKNISDIENKLRKMLMYASDKIDRFEPLFSIDSATKQRLPKGIIARGDIDPLMSYLTFGGMIQLLQLDLALSDKNTSMRDLVEMITSAESLVALQASLKVKIEHRRVWDVIASTVLKQPVTWGAVADDLKKLKEFRNAAAHFRCVTRRDNEEIVEITKRLHTKMEFAGLRELTEDEKKDLTELFDKIYDEMGTNGLFDYNFHLKNTDARPGESTYGDLQSLLGYVPNALSSEDRE